MQLLHELAKIEATFDEQKVVSCAGLVPVMGLAQRCGLSELVKGRVRISSSARPVSKGNPGVLPGAKITAVVAGMLAGADSIDDLDVIRHGGMDRVFGGGYAPSSLGSHLRAYDWGNACQLESASREFLVRLAGSAPVLAGIDQWAYLDIDDCRRRVYGRAKTGAGYGPCKVGGYLVKLKNLNPLLAVLSTLASSPVIATTRLRGGKTHTARGAASFVKEAIAVSQKAGAGQKLMVRLDSGFYNHKVIGAVADAGVYFSVTMPRDPASSAAIASIGDDQWTAIQYPQAIWDEQLDCWVSDAEVAQTTYTAFASTKRPATARLIVRRVRDKNIQTDAGQGELLPKWRYHAVFTDNPHPLVQAEKEHRKHAIVEQVIADVIGGPLAHLPSGSFPANAAWLTCAAIAHNLLRAAGTLASAFHAKARGATLRRQLINIPARIARRLRDHLVLHMPTNWPCKDAFADLFAATMHPRPG